MDHQRTRGQRETISKGWVRAEVAVCGKDDLLPMLHLTIWCHALWSCLVLRPQEDGHGVGSPYPMMEAGDALPATPDSTLEGMEEHPLNGSPLPASISGMCFLAILPSGHMSGHVVEPESMRTYGIMARCVASSSGRPGCTEDNDTDFLRLHIINTQVCEPQGPCEVSPSIMLCTYVPLSDMPNWWMQTNEEAEALISKTGGDMARLAPAESWQIRKHIWIQDNEKVDEAM